jgi:hypothetical protein
VRVVATWIDVERIGLSLPKTALGQAHEGSPAVLVRTQQFARLRWDGAGNEVLQFWVPDPGLVQAYVQDDPELYWGAPGYSKKVVMTRLGGLAEEVVRELLVESWCARAPVSLRRAHPDLR